MHWKKTYKSIKHKANIQNKNSFKLISFCERTFLDKDIGKMRGVEDKREFSRDKETLELMHSIKYLRNNVKTLNGKL